MVSSISSGYTASIVANATANSALKKSDVMKGTTADSLAGSLQSIDSQSPFKDMSVPDRQDLYNMLAKADMNGDGVVTKDELEMLRKTMSDQDKQLRMLSVGKLIQDVLDQAQQAGAESSGKLEDNGLKKLDELLKNFDQLSSDGKGIRLSDVASTIQVNA